MVTDRTGSSRGESSGNGTGPGGNASESEERTTTISPAERWLRIHENAYLHAQKHGFIGGDPFEDWLEAEREVDAKYATDFRGVFTLTDATELTKQFKSVFGGFGFGQHRLDDLLEKHHGNLEKLAATNRKLVDSTSELANKQAEVLQDAVREAVKTLQSVSQGKVSTDGFTKQAELSMRAIENVMSHVRSLTGWATTSSPRNKERGRH